MYIIITILVAITTGAHAQLRLPGACNFTNLDAIKNINESIIGQWYEIARIENSFQQGQCSKSLYYVKNNASIEVANSEVVNKTLVYRNGTVALPTTDAALNITFSDGSYKYMILKTDFANYALLYSCRNEANNTKSVWAWKLVKNVTASSKYTEDFNAVIVTNADLKNATWRLTAHTEDACHVNSSTALYTSPLLIIYAILIGKSYM